MRMNPVGYLINRRDGLKGARGVAYDYILAGNGLWIEAEGERLAARVLVKPFVVRGLADLEPKLVLRYGPVPERFFDLTLDVMLADSHREQYVALTVEDEGYHIVFPEQDRRAAGISGIQLPDNRIMDLHSHPGGIGAYFSGTDNRDEQGFQIYAVVGLGRETLPVVRLRVGVYGYFQEIPWTDVFNGSLVGVTDAWDVTEALVSTGAVDATDDPVEDLEETYAEWWLPRGLARLLAKVEWTDPLEKDDFLRVTGVVT